MTNILQELTGAKQPHFSVTLHALERATGHAGVDVRLIADIMAAAHHVMRSLGLDPKDTTAHELYHSLNSMKDMSLLAGTAYVALKLDGDIISFNADDVAANHDTPYEKRSFSHMRSELKRELAARYKAHARTDEKTVHTLMHEAGLTPEPRSAAPDEPHGNKKPYILCVGDIITDAFIKLSEEYAEVHTDEKGYKRLSFELGAKLPYDSVEIVEAVECSPNAAVSITRLGLRAGLMTWIGDDDPGKSMLKYLENQGVGTDTVVVEKGMKSNYHYVLRYGADRTKLQRFEDYSYEWHEPAQKPDWLYLGVLGEKTWPLHEAMLNYLNKNPAIKLVFQPGMYHLMWGTKKMAPFYKRAEIVILNREEAAQVTGKDRGDIKEVINGLHDLGVTVAVVTDGADGAYASDGQRILFMANYPDPKPPLDRTGAGDAFASTIAAALALGEPLETALQWAPINSMSVVQQMGAQAGLLKQSKLKEYLKTAPKDYTPKVLK